MTIHDDELQQLIGSTVDPTQLKQFDTDAITREARRRTSRNRRLLIASAGLVALAASASAVAIGVPGGQSTPTAQPTGQSSASRMRPACPGPGVVVPENPTASKGDALRSIKVGTSTTVEAVVRSRPHARLLRGELVVGKPGTKPILGPSAEVTADAVARPENHLTRGAAVADVVAAGQKLSVTFKPNAPGRYPVFYLGRYVSSGDCTAPAPPAGTPIAKAAEMMSLLGEIVVE